MVMVESKKASGASHKEFTLPAIIMFAFATSLVLSTLGNLSDA